MTIQETSAGVHARGRTGSGMNECVLISEIFLLRAYFSNSLCDQQTAT